MIDVFNAHLLAAYPTAALFGGMLFFSFVMAPLIFMKLPSDTAGQFIRQVFPIYYLVMACTAGTAALLLTLGTYSSSSLYAAVMGVITIGFLIARQVLMPRINAYRDQELAGNQAAGRAFTRLHRLSVGINLIQLIAASIVLIGIYQASPGPA